MACGHPAKKGWIKPPLFPGAFPPRKTILPLFSCLISPIPPPSLIPFCIQLFFPLWIPLWIGLRVSTEARLQPSPPPHRKRSRAGNSPGNDPFPRQDNTPGEVVRPPWVTQSPFRCRWLVPRGQTCPGGDGCGFKNNFVRCSKCYVIILAPSGMCPLGKLEISLGGVAVRKSVVRKPGPAAAVRALFSGIMREQSSRKATPCGPRCQGSKLPLLGRVLQ